MIFLLHYYFSVRTKQRQRTTTPKTQLLFFFLLPIVIQCKKRVNNNYFEQNMRSKQKRSKGPPQTHQKNPFLFSSQPPKNRTKKEKQTKKNLQDYLSYPTPIPIRDSAISQESHGSIATLKTLDPNSPATAQGANCPKVFPSSVNPPPP